MDKKMVVETTIHNCSCHKQLNQANERIAELEKAGNWLVKVITEPYEGRHERWFGAIDKMREAIQQTDKGE